MSEEGDEKKENQFPPEYPEIEKLVAEAQKEIKGINETINSLPSDKGPEPRLVPKGGPPRPIGHYSANAQQQLKLKALIKRRETIDNIKQLTKNADAAMAKKIEEKAGYLLELDYETKETLGKEKPVQKDFERSSKILSSLYFEGKNYFGNGEPPAPSGGFIDKNAVREDGPGNDDSPKNDPSLDKD